MPLANKVLLNYLNWVLENKMEHSKSGFHSGTCSKQRLTHKIYLQLASLRF